MSVDQQNIVDFIGIAPNGEVVLTISDHLPWGEIDEHFLVLQDKINSYLRFIESSEIFESYPAAKDKDLVISVIMKYEPNESALVFLEACKKIILSAGIEFEWQHTTK